MEKLLREGSSLQPGSAQGICTACNNPQLTQASPLHLHGLAELQHNFHKQAHLDKMFKIRFFCAFLKIHNQALVPKYDLCKNADNIMLSLSIS